MVAEPVRPPRLPEACQVALVALFGLVCVLLIWFFDVPGVHRLELLTAATSGAALLTSLAWFFALAVCQRSLWALAFALPYVNVMAASFYARRYWRHGARGPAVLGLLGLLLQILASLGALFADPARLV